MATSTVTSGFGKLNIADYSKGALLAVINAVLTTVYTSLSAGSLSFNWKAIGLVAATTAVSYLLKNFFTPAVLQTPVNPS